jgi:O-antigen ligase
MALYVLGLVMTGFGADPIVGGRVFALFALLGLAYLLATWRYGAKRALLWAIVITVLIGFSLSRMAFVAALALFPLAQRPSKGVREVARVAIGLVLVAAIGYSAITYVEPLHDRFFSGDMSLEIGGVSFNASGRTAFWKAIFASYMESWLIGKGAGSSEMLIQTSFVDIDHPHNDYLRILHDYGLVGLVLWLSAMCVLLWRVGRAWIRADRLNCSEAPLHLCAFLVLVAVSLMMTSDNAMVYIYIMGPAGALVGTSLGARTARRDARPSFISSIPSCAQAVTGAAN